MISSDTLCSAMTTEPDTVKDFFQSLTNARTPSPTTAASGSHSPQDEQEPHNSTDSSGGANNSVENIFKIGNNIPQLRPELNVRSSFPLGNMTSFLEALRQNSGALEQGQLGLDFGALLGATSSSQTADDQDRASSNRSAAEPEDLSLRERAQNEESSASGTASNWTFEEQFKQLYELSPDRKRKEWLDDWFMFMQKNGKPVTRIPIMAKQVLDLYELYRLVVSHGGLVEIINKKLWREITKGLNLPSSITSAAFTLRTQYQKYLYDYECDRERLSTPADLQAAIEGNKREGRRNNASLNGTQPGQAFCRGGVGQPAGFPYPMVSSLFSKHFNQLIGSEPDHMTPNAQMMNAVNAAYRDQFHGLDHAPNRQLDIFQRLAEAMGKANPGISGRDSHCSGESDPVPAKRLRPASPAARPKSESPIPKPLDQLLKNSHAMQFKMNSSRMPSGEKSMVVSMEINGTAYQGVLFPTANPNAENQPVNGDALAELFKNGRDWNED